MDALDAPEQAGSRGPDSARCSRRVIIAEPTLTIEGVKLSIVEFGDGESKHIAAVYLPGLKALLSADMVYNQAHLYLQEKHIESWLAPLDELGTFTKDRVTTIHPGHGKEASLELIGQTRNYLCDFADALKSGSAKNVEEIMLERCRDTYSLCDATGESVRGEFRVWSEVISAGSNPAGKEALGP
jgi:glyoxylase-like metal-dependent hydrolase (beta-lactamase superfamily II)